MNEVGELLRSGYYHAKRSKELADEVQRLAMESCLHVIECYKIAASIHDIVMEAARPYLEQAKFHVSETRRLYAECLGANLKQPASIN